MKKYESYLNSPFRVEGVESRQYIQKVDEKLWVDPETSEMYSVKRVPKNKEQLNDSMSYTKLFVEGRSKIMKLSGTGLRVLVYGMCVIRPLSQTVVLNIPDIQVEANLASSNTIRTAICELIEAGILAQKLGSNIEFWVNPNVFFNGNRLRLL
jgi:hypothetical protein